MAKVGFIGLGNMGLPMAQNLLKADYVVTGFDLNAHATERLEASGGRGANSLADACKDVEVVITMLPAGEQVREVYLGDDGVLAAVAPGTLLIDSSTIDVKTARDVAQAAQGQGLAMVDAPVSGGVAGAEAGTLTFMVGGGDDAFERARPLLEKMGKTIVPAGGKARPRCAEAVRHFLEVVRTMLVDDELLPGAGPGADVACEPRLQGGLHRGHDAQGFEAGASRRARDARHHSARRRRCRGLRALRGKRRRQRRFFRHHSLLARSVKGRVGTLSPCMRACASTGALRCFSVKKG